MNTSTRTQAAGWIILSLLGAAAPPASAGAPLRISYQGKLGDASGNPLTGAYNFVFRVYPAETGGAASYAEAQPGVGVVNGVYSVHIGSFTPIPAAAFASEEAYLEVEVNGETLEPRERLASVPYALQAAASDRLGAGAVVATFTSAGHMLFPGNVGVGTTGPSHRLDVNGGLIVRSSVSLAGASAPEAAPAGQGAIYFDSASNKFRVSENGGSYVDLVAGDVGGGWTRDGAVVRLTAPGDNVVVASTLTVAGAAFSVGGSTLAAAAGRVGVGLAAPGTLLEVSGQRGADNRGQVAVRGGDHAFISVQSDNPAVGGAGIQLVGLGSFSAPRWSVYTPPASDRLDFYGWGPGGQGAVMSLEYLGNVGIGTTQPAQRLDVGGGVIIRSSWTLEAMSAPPAAAAGRGAIYFDSAANRFRVSENAGSYVDLVAGEVGGGWTHDGTVVRLSAPGDNVVVASTLTVRGDAFSVGGSTLVAAGGRVGIGTSAPTHRLDVGGGAVVRSSVTVTGVSAPPASAAGQGAIYFDSAANKFRVSENAGSYVDLVGGVVGGGWSDDGSVVRPTSAGDNVVIASTLTVRGNAFSVGGSTLVAAGGRVGIGTSAPTHRLDVGGGAVVRSSVTLAGVPAPPSASAGQGAIYFDSASNKFRVSESAGAYVDLVGGDVGGGWTREGSVVRLTAPSDNVVVASTLTVRGDAFSVGGSTLVAAGGRVGIGTSAPTHRLDVNGGGAIVRSSSVTVTGMSAPAAADAGQGAIYFDSASNRFRVSENGGPYADLVGGAVGGGWSDDGSVVRPTSAGDNVVIASTLTVRGAAFSVGGSTLVVASGMVGIGTSQPAQSLDVAGGGVIVRSSWTLEAMSAPAAAPAGRGAIFFDSASNRFKVSENAGLYVDLVGGAVGGGWTDDGSVVRLSAPGDSVVVQSTLTVQGGGFSVAGATFAARGGRVGIGTSAPGDALEVLGGRGIGATGVLVAGRFVTPDASNVGGVFLAGDADGGVIGPTAGSQKLKVKLGAGLDAAAMTFLPSGDVGIGTTDPQVRLHVSGGALRVGDGYGVGAMDQDNASRISMFNDKFDGGVAGLEILGSNRSIVLRNGGAERLRVDTGGRVGVGTTIPSAELHVSSAGASPEATLLFVSSGASAGQEILVVKGDGKVGIGVAAPAAPLDVGGRVFAFDGTAALPAYSFSGQPGVGMFRYNNGVLGFAAGAGMRLQVDENNQEIAHGLPMRSGTGGTLAAPAYSYTADPNTGLLFPAAGVVALAADGAEWLRVAGTGRVGVGTQAPSTRLHVSGGDIQVGDADASTISASGYLSLANRGSAPPLARGRIFFDSTGQGALRISLDGLTYVALATGTVAGGGGGDDPTKVAKTGDTMTGPLVLSNASLTLTGPGGDIATQSSVTASAFFGDGSALAGITTSDPSKVAKAGDGMTGPLTLLDPSTLTVKGAAFSVGGSTLVAVSGRVGIGTTGPVAGLHLLSGADGGVPSMDGAVTAVFQKNPSAAYSAAVAVLGAEKSILGFADKDYIYAGRVMYDHNSDSMWLWTNGNTRGGLNIRNTGDVGVGFPWGEYPSAALHVSSANAAAADLLLKVSSGASPGQELLLVRGDGKIGIGTTSPAAQVHLANADANTRLLIGSLNNHIQLRDLAGGNDSYIYMAGADSRLRFCAGGSGCPAKMVFDSSGKLGIGTTNPAAALEVSGQVKITGGSPAAGRILTSDSAGLASWQVPSGAGSGWTDAGAAVQLADPADWAGMGTSNPAAKVHVSSGGLLIDGDAAVPLRIGTATFTVTADGKVGIGTNYFNSGWNVLTISQNTHTRLNVRSDSTGNAAAGVRLSGRNAGVEREWTLDARGGSDAPNDRFSLWWAANFERFTVLSSGEVGINANNPGSRLSVAGNAAIGATYAAAAAPTDGAIIEGKVGIGTTNPSEKLEVSGNIGLLGSSGNIYFGDPNIRIYRSGNNLVLDNLNSVQVRYALKPLGTASLGEDGLRWQDYYGVNGYYSGNVGIGTTSPGAKLEVGGQVKITGGSPGAGKLLASDASGLASWQTPSGAGSGWTEDGGVVRLGDPADNAVVASTLTVQGDAFSVGGATLAVSSGRVGVGTTAPGRQLDVNGDVNISGDLYTDDSVSVRLPANSDGLRLYANEADDSVGLWVTRIGSDWLALAGNETYQQAVLKSSNLLGRQLVLGSYVAKDYGHPVQANNTLFIHSTTDPDVDNTQWGSLTHNTADFVYDAGKGGHLFRIAGGDKAILGAAGNLGLGTVSPATRLDVEGDAQFGSGAAKSTFSANGSLFLDQGATLQVGLQAGATLFAGGGKVGIGTSDPGGYKLKVQGDAQVVFSLVANELGLGTSAIGSKLQVNGNAVIGYSGATVGPANGLAVSGSVGIGTTSPGAALHVSSANASAQGTPLLVSSGAAAGQELLAVKGDGRVGLGTAAPTHRLDVNGGAVVRSSLTLAGAAAPAASASGQGAIYFDSSANKFRISENGSSYGDLVAGGADGWKDDGGTVRLTTPSDIVVVASTLTVYGSVGIGTTQPSPAKLHAVGVTGYAYSLLASSGTGPGSYALAVTTYGSTGIRISTPMATLHIIAPVTDAYALIIATSAAAGAELIQVSTTGVLRAKRGVTYAGDLAEMYPAAEPMQPGEAAALAAPVRSGPDGSGQGFSVAAAREGMTLLGVVSTDPGLTIGDGDAGAAGPAGRVAVALSGRVPVKASLENGPILPGDPLAVSSRHPGRVAKAVRSGRVLGFALEGLPGRGQAGPDTGTILCYVNSHYWVAPQEFAELRREVESLRRRVDSGGR